MPTQPCLVIGIGNENRSDDAVGLLIARRIQEKVEEGVLSEVEVFEHTGEATSLMELWQGASKVIVVDATQSGKSPGSIICHNASQEPLPAVFESFSSHVFSVPQAVELSRNLGTLPQELFVIGVEGKSFDHGVSLSEEVRSEISTAVERIIETAIMEGTDA